MQVLNTKGCQVLFSACKRMGETRRMKTNRIFILIGGLVLILGSRLPWVSFPVLYGLDGPAYEALEIGWEGGGFFTGGLGLVLLLIGIFWKGRKGKIYSIPAMILAGLALLYIFGSLYRVIEMHPEEGFFRATDIGLYLTLFGGLLGLVGAVWRTPDTQEPKESNLLIVFVVSGLVVATLLLVRAKLAAPALEPMAPNLIAADAQPVVIDTDMAADDWLAILYLLSHPGVDVRAITVTGAGEAHCPAGVQNALDLAALAGRPTIPVACGRETPLAGDHTFPAAWRERVDDLLGLTLPENNNEPSSDSAVELLTRIIQGSPKKIHLITLGPLTNVGEALAAEPELVMNLEMITVMGGAVEVTGNVSTSSKIENQTAEWNIYVDPHAAALVFGSGAPVTLIPLDATNNVPLTMDFFRRLEKDQLTPIAAFAFRVLAEQEPFIRMGTTYFWDPLAAAIATEEGLADFTEKTLIVIEEEGPESGRTLESEKGSLIRVAVGADGERFEDLLLDAANGRLP